MKNLKIAALLFVSLLMLQSCVKDDKDENLDTAPALAAEETFIMPFTGFEDADTSGIMAPPNDNSANARTPSFDNWFHSATNVVFWNLVLTVNLAVPTAAFHESFNHDPTFQGNGVWLWQYSFELPDGNYQAKLYGEIVANDEVEWEMYISKVGGFQDVLWYTGSTNDDEAHWTLNHQANNPEAFIQIDYLKDNGNAQAAIRYTNIIPNDPGNGGYIEYREDNSNSSADYNRAYDIYHIQADNLIEIQWNKPNENGRVKDEEHFGDTEWHCWDVNLMDTEC